MADEENIPEEFPEEVLQNDRYRIVMLNNGQSIIGRITNATGYGMLLKNPVVCSIEDSEVFFTVLFNGMSRSKSFFFSINNILTVGMVDDDIKEYYERYLTDTAKDVEEFKQDTDYQYSSTTPAANVITQLLSNIKGTIH
jgi:hypothetical protein